MPTYEFICQKCGARFEARQTIAEHALKTPSCTRCGADRVERVPSTFVAQTTRKA